MVWPKQGRAWVWRHKISKPVFVTSLCMRMQISFWMKTWLISLVIANLLSGFSLSQAPARCYKRRTECQEIILPSMKLLLFKYNTFCSQDEPKTFAGNLFAGGNYFLRSSNFGEKILLMPAWNNGFSCMTNNVPMHTWGIMLTDAWNIVFLYSCVVQQRNEV